MSHRQQPTPIYCLGCAARIELKDGEAPVTHCWRCKRKLSPIQIDATRVRQMSSTAVSFKRDCLKIAQKLIEDGRPPCRQVASELRQLADIFASWEETPPLDDAERTSAYSRAYTALRRGQELLSHRRTKKP